MEIFFSFYKTRILRNCLENSLLLRWRRRAVCDWLLIWDVILKSWGSLENLLEWPRLAPVSYLSDCSKTLFGESSFTVLQWGSKQGGSEFLGKLWSTPSICRFILWFLNGSFRTKQFFCLVYVCNIGSQCFGIYLIAETFESFILNVTIWLFCHT